MTSITHLIPDSAFVPFMTSVYEEALPGGNEYLVYGASGSLDRHRVPLGVRLRSVDADGADEAEIDRTIAERDIVIAHSMSTLAASAFLAAPDRVFRVWSGWGGDYYGNAWSSSWGLVSRRTRRLWRRSRRFDVRVWSQQLASLPYVSRLYRETAAAVDAFSAPVPTDLEVFQRRFPMFRGVFHQLNYASVEDIYATEPDLVSGDDVLVGNSATPENNHVETLERLAGIDLGRRQVVIPLSYGDARYAADVADAAKELVGGSARPILDYLPLSEYNALIGSCGIVLMGHRRQQGLANVARAMWQGADVYLDDRNPMLEFFRDVGLPCHRLADLDSARFATSGGARDPHRLELTRAAARRIWGRDVVVDNIRSLIAANGRLGVEAGT